MLSENIKLYRKSLINLQLSERTIKKYLQEIEQLYNFLHKNNFITDSLNEMADEDLKSYSEYLLNKIKISSYNTKCIILNRFFRYKKLKFKMRLIKQQRKNILENVINKTDIIKLMNKIHECNDIRMETVIETLLYTGIRISELSSVNTEALYSGYIRILNKRKERIVILPKKLILKLRKYHDNYSIKNKNPNRSIFQTNKGTDLNLNYFRKKLKIYGRMARINTTKMYPHNFRHFYAKKFLEKGGDITMLKDLLGHSSLDTTSIYLQYSLQEQRNIVNRLFHNE